MLRSPRSQLTTGLLLAAAGAMAFSGKAIIVKLAYRHGAGRRQQQTRGQL